MSCRNTSCGSAFTSYAHLTTPTMSDRATLSTFHGLRDRYLNQPEESRQIRTVEDYHGLLQRQKSRVARNTTLTDAQKETMQARLDAALQEEMPEQAIVYACFNIRPTLRHRADAQRVFLEEIAARTGETYQATAEEFAVIAREAPRNVRPSREDAALAAGLSMSRDMGTVLAIQTLTVKALDVEAAVAARSPQRVTATVQVPENLQHTGTAGGSITSYGYDERVGRLEIMLQAEGSEVSDPVAYRNVPRSVYDRFTSHPGAVWNEDIRGNVDYQYPTRQDAIIHGAAPRCRICGQYADNQHGCPDSPQLIEQTPRWTRHTVTQYYTGHGAAGTTESTDTALTLPTTAVLQRALRDSGSAEIPLRMSLTYVPGDYPTENSVPGQVTGTCFLFREAGSETPTFNTASLACTCQEYRRDHTCPHLTLVTDALRDRVDPPTAEIQTAREAAGRAAAVAAAATRVQREYTAALASDWTRNETTAAEAAATWRRDSDVLYSENEAAFTADIERALDLTAANGGEPAIPYMRENALDGLAQRGSGQAFGVEIEYTFRAGVATGAANERIGRELYAAGLTSTPRQQGYRASSNRGFRDTHQDANGVGNWSFENDCSVNGELVTPGMYDEPETWRNLETALEILTRNGAVASTRAGAHVHVGTGNWHGQVAPYVELARLVTQHEDTIVRLASDVRRGTHRGTSFTGPMQPVPPAGFRSVAAVRSWQGGRYAMVNFHNCSGGREDHPEFRVFDATLNPGAIQAQIKLAVASTAAAERIAASGGTSRGVESWGAHARRQALSGQATRRRSSNTATNAARIAEDSGTVRSFLDTLFRRREDKAQLAAVFAHTRWPAPAPVSRW